MVNVHFSDFFGVSHKSVVDYGAFNVSVVADLPLFVDPFLLFNNPKDEYQTLHQDILKYLRFLLEKSRTPNLPAGLVGSWFTFPEVKQNWLGYSKTGNRAEVLERSSLRLCIAILDRYLTTLEVSASLVEVT